MSMIAKQGGYGLRRQEEDKAKRRRLCSKRKLQKHFRCGYAESEEKTAGDNPHAVQQRRAVRRARRSGAHAVTHAGARGAAGCCPGGCRHDEREESRSEHVRSSL